MFQHLASAVISLGLSLWALRANGQTTEAACLPSFSWMNNERNQSPCLVVAYLEGACLPDGHWSVSALTSADTSYANLKADQASPCTCSSVSFNLLSACAFCQGFNLLDWGDWIANCSVGLISNGQYPHEIPSGTSVPSWAYQIVIDTFNVAAAESVAASHPPDSVAPEESSTFATRSTVPPSIATTSHSTKIEIPSSSITPSTLSATSNTAADTSSTVTASSGTTTSSSSQIETRSSSPSTPPMTTSTGADTQTVAAKSSDHTGAIVGGVVGGLVAVLTALLGAYFLYTRSQRARYALPITALAQYDSQHAPLTEAPSPPPHIVPFTSSSRGMAPDTRQMKSHNA